MILYLFIVDVNKHEYIQSDSWFTNITVVDDFLSLGDQTFV